MTERERHRVIHAAVEGGPAATAGRIAAAPGPVAQRAPPRTGGGRAPSPGRQGSARRAGPSSSAAPRSRDVVTLVDAAGSGRRRLPRPPDRVAADRIEDGRAREEAAGARLVATTPEGRHG